MKRVVSWPIRWLVLLPIGAIAYVTETVATMVLAVAVYCSDKLRDWEHE